MPTVKIPPVLRAQTGGDKDASEKHEGDWVVSSCPPAAHTLSILGF